MRSFWKLTFFKFKEFRPWLLAGIAALLAGVAGNAMWETIQAWREWTIGKFDVWNWIIILLFFVMVAKLYYLRKVFFKPRTRYLRDITKVPKREHLVVFLSELAQGSYTNGVPT